MDKEEFRKFVINSFQKRKNVLVYSLAKRLRKENLHSLNLTEDSTEDISWVKIESLSQLRSLVGGRFLNLKEKWLAAGFPLREHRGDRDLGANINDTGWLEFNIWINKRGFEARLCDLGVNALFEIRKIL